VVRKEKTRKGIVVPAEKTMKGPDERIDARYYVT
jgi:hypothetical protein